MADRPPARSRSIVAFVVALSLAAVSTPYAASPVWAAFSATTTTASSSMAAKRIFTGTRTVVPHTLHDVSNGTDTDNSDPVYATDSLKYITGTWSNNFAANRYVEYDLDSPQPAGLATTAVTFDFGYADSKSGGADQACYYFEVRRISTGALVNTYGSSTSPISCNTASTFVTDHTSIVGDVGTTDIANDLRVRVYMKETANATVNWIDLATVTVTTANSTITEYDEAYTDQATGTPTTGAWGVANVDAFNYQSKGNWPTSYATTKYVSYTFPSSVPAGATVTGATLTHSYRPQAASTLCYYFEVYNGATLVAAHGSTSSNVSCNTSATTFVTDNVALPEINTVAEANAVTVRIYMKTNPGKPSQQDVVNLAISWSLT